MRTISPTPRALARRVAGATVAVAALVAGAAQAQPASGVEQPNVDRSVRIQDDFYRHVNGGWLKNTPIPSDRPGTGAFLQIHETIQPQLLQLIEEAARSGRDAEAKQIGDLYASFMDEAALEKLGARPIAADLAAIDALSDRQQLGALMARSVRIGIGMPVAFYVGQDDRDSTRYATFLSQSGLGLPDRDYYLKEDDARFKDVRAKYLDYLQKVLALAGDKDPAASAAAVLALETELARVQWTKVENRDPVKTYNKVEVDALPKLAPAIDWKTFLAGTGVAGKAGYVIVAQPSYFEGLSKLAETAPLASWKAYAKVRTVNAFAPFLSKEFVDTRFAFVGTVLRGTPENLPRWKRGVSLVEESIGEGLGKVYVTKYFPPEHKARMEKLVANLLLAYKQSIDQLDWMTPATRRQAQAKLAKFTPKIGYPKQWLDYRSLKIQRDDLAGNVRHAREFAHARMVDKLGKPIDRDEWLITPQTVNAYYNPGLNEIVFPAAILQPPFFNAAADDAVNYGGIGMVIGHEISHGFDDQGSQYDGDGNLRDWWTSEDRDRFNAKTKALVAQYNAFVPVPGYPVNGELTLGENIADNSGLEIAHKAYRLSLGGKPAPVIDGLSGDQRFFYGFAQVWRSKTRDAAMVEQVKSDPHSPDEFRANGAVRNHPAFYPTFDVKPGDAMYLPPEQRVSIW